MVFRGLRQKILFSRSPHGKQFPGLVTRKMVSRGLLVVTRKVDFRGLVHGKWFLEACHSRKWFLRSYHTENGFKGLPHGKRFFRCATQKKMCLRDLPYGKMCPRDLPYHTGKGFSGLPHGERFLLVCHIENGFRRLPHAKNCCIYPWLFIEEFRIRIIDFSSRGHQSRNCQSKKACGKVFNDLPKAAFAWGPSWRDKMAICGNTSHPNGYATEKISNNLIENESIRWV